MAAQKDTVTAALDEAAQSQASLDVKAPAKPLDQNSKEALSLFAQASPVSAGVARSPGSQLGSFFAEAESTGKLTTKPSTPALTLPLR